MLHFQFFLKRLLYSKHESLSFRLQRNAIQFRVPFLKLFLETDYTRVYLCDVKIHLTEAGSSTQAPERRGSFEMFS